MALKKSISTVHGIQVNDAYFRVEDMVLQTKNSMRFVVRAYADPSKVFLSEQIVHANYKIDEENPFKQAYLFLKTLRDFDGAVDC